MFLQKRFEELKWLLLLLKCHVQQINYKFYRLAYTVDTILFKGSCCKTTFKEKIGYGRMDFLFQ